MYSYTVYVLSSQANCTSNVRADFIRRYSALKSMVQRCMVHVQLTGQVASAGGALGGARAPGGAPMPHAAAGVSVLVAEAVHTTAARARHGLCEQCSVATSFDAHPPADSGATWCALSADSHY